MSTLYWRIFNFAVRRVVALAFVIGGLAIAVINIPALLPGGTITIDGIPSTDLIFRLIAVILPIVMAIMGVMLFSAKPFSPSVQR